MVTENQDKTLYPAAAVVDVVDVMNDYSLLLKILVVVAIKENRFCKNFLKWKM